jgi:hypothetical protein
MIIRDLVNNHYSYIWLANKTPASRDAKTNLHSLSVAQYSSERSSFFCPGPGMRI